jgi:hypothetical protein
VTSDFVLLSKIKEARRTELKNLKYPVYLVVEAENNGIILFDRKKFALYAIPVSFSQLLYV